MSERLANQKWWKIASIALLTYTIIGGFLIPVPARFILNETIRNLYFHVPMWFTMLVLMSISVAYAIRYLGKGQLKEDFISVEAANTGVLFSILGLITGMIWARFTWGAWWVNDPKLNGVAVVLLIYLAYFVLRSSTDDLDKRARISSVYNIFAFITIIPLMYILPKLTDSLHPGSGGNPAFNMYDLDGNMRLVFYPATIGWILLGTWIFTLKARWRIFSLQKMTNHA